MTPEGVLSLYAYNTKGWLPTLNLSIRKELKILTFVFLLFAIPVLCAYFWGLYKAYTFVSPPDMPSSEVAITKAFIIHHWAGSGFLLGFIFLVYAVVMRILFALIGGIMNLGFRMVHGKPQKFRNLKGERGNAIEHKG